MAGFTNVKDINKQLNKLNEDWEAVTRNADRRIYYIK